MGKFLSGVAWAIGIMLLVVVLLCATFGPLLTVALIVLAALDNVIWWWPVATGAIVAAAWSLILIVYLKRQSSGVWLVSRDFPMSRFNATAWILWRMLLVFVALFAVVLGPVATFTLAVMASLGRATWWWPVVIGVLVLAAWGFILVVKADEEAEE